MPAQRGTPAGGDGQAPCRELSSRARGWLGGHRQARRCLQLPVNPACKLTTSQHTHDFHLILTHMQVAGAHGQDAQALQRAQQEVALAVHGGRLWGRLLNAHVCVACVGGGVTGVGMEPLTQAISRMHQP